MADEPDYIIVTIESDSDDNSNHSHNEVMLLEESTSEISSDVPTMDTSSDESPVIQPDFQDYNYEQQFQLASGEGTSQGDQAVPQVNLSTLKRRNSNSGDFTTPTKRGRQSTELEDKMILCQLIEKLNGQVNQLYGMVSKMHHFWEKSQIHKCGHCCSLFEDETMATHEQDRTIGTSLESVSYHEQQQQQEHQQQPALSQESVSYHEQQQQQEHQQQSALSQESVSYHEQQQQQEHQQQSALSQESVSYHEQQQQQEHQQQSALSQESVSYHEQQQQQEHQQQSALSQESVSYHEQQQQQEHQQQSALSQDSFLPRIISTNSLTQEGSVADVHTVPDTLNENAESSDIVISDAQPTMEAPAAVLLPQEPSPANNHNFVNYSTVVGEEGTTIISTNFPCLLVPHNFEMPENEEIGILDDTVILNVPNLENDGEQSTNLPYVFTNDDGVSEARLENNSESVSSPLVMGNDNDHDSSADCLPPDSGFERVILIEMPEQTELNGQTLYYPALLGHFNLPDSEMTPASEASHSGMPAVTEESLENNMERMDFPLVNENAPNTSSAHTLPSGSGFEKVILIEVPGQTGVNGQTLYYPALLGYFNDPDSEMASAFAASNSDTEDTIVIEISEDAEIISQALNNPGVVGHFHDSDSENVSDSESTNLQFPLLIIEEDNLESNPAVENYSDHSSSSFSRANLPPDSDVVKVILIEMPQKVKVNGQIVIYPGLLGRIITSNSEAASVSGSSYVGYEEVILDEIPFDPETMDLNDSEIMENPFELGNDSDSDDEEEDNESPFFSIPLYFDDQESIPVRVNCPVAMENREGQDNIPLITGFAYLGDPRRNIKIHNIHLVTTEKMTKPSLAACYLVYVLFSEETLINSSASISGLGCPDLDPNRMAAIREHLAGIFLQYDLTENGNDWSICISSIRRLVENLCIEVQTHLHEVALLCSGRNDGGEASNQPCGKVLYGRRVLCGTRNGKPVTCYVEQLGHLGHSSRHVQVPRSVMTIAKTKRSPELSARYLSQYLVTEELSKTTIFDNMRCDVYNLDNNTIAAIQEFLQESFPSWDLMEDSDDWKVCLAAICSSTRAFRHELKDPKVKADVSHPSTEE